MNTDHFFTIGTMHVSQGTPCEDYALSGRLGRDLVFGAVADGCSGASANTDIGARTIGWAFARTLAARTDRPGEWFRGEFFDEFKKNFASPRLTEAEDDYLATVVGFAATPSRISVFLMGDGAIATKNGAGLHRLIEFDWTGNTPYYLNYVLRAERRARFLESLAGPPSRAVSRRTTTFTCDESGITILNSAAENLEFAALAEGIVLDFRPQDEGLVALAVLTDGISQIGKVPATLAAARFLAFKSTCGKFVKRRMGKALASFGKNGEVARDDVAMACVQLGGEYGNV